MYFYTFFDNLTVDLRKLILEGKTVIVRNANQNELNAGNYVLEIKQ